MSQPTKTDQKIRPTPTIEDYLAVMFVMERDGEEIIAARLAESLEVAPPTVTVTLKRMERDGWITLEGHKGIYLTEAGREASYSVIRRHMLTEWMLARMLGIPWSSIHEEAHNIEHTISDDVEARLRATLDDPQLCPHGNPMPGYEHITTSWVPLTDFNPGNEVIIRRIHEVAEDDPKLLNYLLKNGVIPGSKATIDESLSFNQTMSLIVGENKVVLGFIAAKYIFAEKAE
jgi:DtxR family Mn-dependent transcriptional regulator